MIKLIDVSKKYGSKTVLNGITLDLLPGHVYGIVGENGAGKTTLFRCIAGLESGDGTIDAGGKSIKNHLGFLTTEPYFFPRMTGREYVQLWGHARGKKITQLDEKNIFDLPLDQYAAQYSTGMKKKLAFLALLLQDNDFFILDEPFNGVDIQSNIIITEIILRLKALQKTVIISSHIFSTLKDTCDIIYVIQDGQITRSVTSEEFESLEEEMKNVMIGDKIDRLGI